MDGPMETIDGVETGNTVAPNRPTVATQQCELDVDALAQEIRRIDGSNSLGAGALAEALMPFLAALPASEAGWREITEDEFPPYDTEVLMGFWESWPSQKWVVEYGLYGSTKGGWISGSVTHWLPSSFLPSAPDRRA